MKLLSVALNILIIFFILISIIITHYSIPDNYLPWEPLKLDDGNHFIARNKLAQNISDFDNCTNLLTTNRISFRRLEDKVYQSCTLKNQIFIDKGYFQYSNRLNGECKLLATLLFWEQSVLEPLIKKYFSSDIHRINHYGVFSCRNIKNSSRISQHAFANAIDIAGFDLKNGFKISVLNDWGKNTSKGKFLKELRDSSCSVFRTTLSPDYNKTHANHFHFDMGPYSVCK